MIDYSEDWLILLIFKLKGSVMVRASIFAVPAAMFALFLVSIDEYIPNFRKDFGFDDAGKSQLWSATTGVLAILLGFRTNRAMSRFWEGTGLLHQMRGEWFDSVSCCVTFSRAASDAKPKEVKYFRHTIVRLMSLCHGSALEEIAGNASGSITAIDSFGLDTATLRHLKECKEKHGFNRVEVLLHLTQSIITKGLDDGILKIPPPILSRVYQTLSRGFVNLLNAKKIADTRFPFPYAQIITMLLLAHVALTPIMLSCLVEHKVMCPLFTFVPIFGMFYLNFVGVELENPFGDDDNDLPLDHFQSEMNNCLLMLLQENADLISTIDPSRCTLAFKTLKESLRENHDGDGSAPTNSEMNHRRISHFEWTFDPDNIEASMAMDSLHKDRGGHAGGLGIVTSIPIASMANPGFGERPEKMNENKQQLLAPQGPPPPAKEVKATSNQPMSETEKQRSAEKLEPGIFTGAIESFLEASHPMILNKGDTALAQGSPPAQEPLQPSSEHAQFFFIPAPPYGDPGVDHSPRQLVVAEPLPDPSRTALPTIVPKTTRLQDLVPNKKDRQFTSVKGGNGKGGASTAEPKKLEQGVERSMGEFKEALDTWTQLIEGQLTELRQNVSALRRFSDTIPELLEVGKHR